VGDEIVVAAHDLSTGAQLWLARPGTHAGEWGFSNEPVLYRDKVIVDGDGKGDSFLVALNRTDGKVAWRVKRDHKGISYSAPLIRQMAGRLQMVVPGNKAVTSLDPRTGRTLWNVDGPSDDSVITPVYNERAGLVLSCSSWPKKVLLAIKPDGDGNVTASKIAWTSTDGAPYVPSPISVGDWFFTSSSGSKEVCCFAAATGEILWHEKMGLHHASPVLANGRLYFLNDDGVAHVFKAGPKFDLVGRNELGERTYASPAISRGQIFLRGFKNLYCLGKG